MATLDPVPNGVEKPRSKRSSRPQSAKPEMKVEVEKKDPEGDMAVGDMSPIHEWPNKSQEAEPEVE